MGSLRRPRRPFCIFIAVAASLALGSPTDALAASNPAPSSGGGALAPPPTQTTQTTQSATPPTPGPPDAHAKGLWLAQVTISEYWAVPESWFSGALVTAPGLAGKHRIDWLYSATGMSMNGQGIGLDGRVYHVARLGFGGWVTAAGKPTDAAKGWLGGAPFWRSGGYWRNAAGGVTFPHVGGGWSAGTGRRYVPLPGASFAAGAARSLRAYGSIAVDPRVIPLGSRVYIPAYRNDGYGGWFVAQDTGGAILGHRIDVYRTPPPTRLTAGQYLTSQRVFVVRAPS